jgi:hypothetical protein
VNFAIETDILFYPSDESSPLHGKASDFLMRCATGREVFALRGRR